MLKANDKAPGFTLPDQDGDLHSLSDYQGKWLLIYFYPRDFTSGCTKEACSFRDNFEKFGGKLQIVGISGDTVLSHKKFSEKHKLPFTLLSDADKKVIRSYGTDGFILAKRTSFLISPKGIVKKIYKKVNPAKHSEEILVDISELAP